MSDFRRDLPFLDEETLARQTTGDRALQRELFRSFLEQGERYVDAMHEAGASKDAKGWTMAAHGLKGASRSLGLVRLAALSDMAESAGKPDIALAEQIGRALDEARIRIEARWRVRENDR